MKYEVIWSGFSEFQLDEIFEYYENETSLSVAIEIIQVF